MREEVAPKAWIDKAQRQVEALAREARLPREQSTLLTETLEQLLRAQQLVETEQLRYRELLEFAPDGYLVTDPYGLIHTANQAAAEVLGATGEALVGKPLAAYVDKADRECFVLGMARLRGSAGGERERLLSENKRQRAFLERLLAAVPVGVAVVSGPNHRFETVNPTYHQIPGVPGEGTTFTVWLPA